MVSSEPINGRSDGPLTLLADEAGQRVIGADGAFDTLKPRDDSRLQVQARDLVKHYGSTQAVQGVSLDIAEGERFGLLGPSGCGKTTTLRAIAGLERIDDGEIRVGGDVVVSVERGLFVPPERRDMAMVFQAYAIWPHMTVWENVAFPLKVRKCPRAERDVRVREALENTGLGGKADMPATALSGGQQQRVALARALVYSPKVLLLDEPLSNLDANLREEMRDEIVRLQESLGLTVIFVTHDRFEAMALSDRVAIMNEGKVEQVGSPQAVYERPRTAFVRDFLGSAVVVAGNLELDPAGGWSVVIDQAFGRGRVYCQEPPADASPGARVWLACRPEDVSVHSLTRGSAQEAGATATAVVESTVYQGTHVECLARVGEATVKLWVPRQDKYDVGSQLQLELDADKCWVQPE